MKTLEQFIIDSNIVHNNKYHYEDYKYEIIEEIKTTNLNSAKLEEEFIKNNKVDKFEFPDDYKFAGYTECFNIDIKEN